MAPVFDGVPGSLDLHTANPSAFWISRHLFYKSPEDERIAPQLVGSSFKHFLQMSSTLPFDRGVSKWELHVANERK